MGIYNDGNVYGVRIVTYDDINCEEMAYLEKKYDTKINLEQIAYIKKEYETIFKDVLPDTSLRVFFYTSCVDTYDPDSIPWMGWWNGSVESLEELFEKGDTRI